MNGTAANQFVRSHEIDWKPLNEPDVSGISVKVLQFDEAVRRAPTILLKFEVGARYPAHNHRVRRPQDHPCEFLPTLLRSGVIKLWSPSTPFRSAVAHPANDSE